MSVYGVSCTFFSIKVYNIFERATAVVHKLLGIMTGTSFLLKSASNWFTWNYILPVASFAPCPPLTSYNRLIDPRCHIPHYDISVDTLDTCFASELREWHILISTNYLLLYAFQIFFLSIFRSPRQPKFCTRTLTSTAMRIGRWTKPKSRSMPTSSGCYIHNRAGSGSGAAWRSYEHLYTS